MAVLNLLFFGAPPPQKVEASLKRLLPSPTEVRGWRPIKGTYVFCPTPKSLTKLYDGGYMDYVKRGVLSAVSVTYGRKSPSAIVIVTVHLMKDHPSALKLYAWLKAQAGKGAKIRSLPLPFKGCGGCTLNLPGGAAAYGWCRKHVVVVNGNGENLTRVVGDFLRKILTKLAPKAKKGRR